jgi:hypothetical protein
MRTKLFLIVCVVVPAFGSTSLAQDERPFMGVLLDCNLSPLPRLLTRHLGLDPEQGLRVINVGVGTSADAAGLEPDDIIVAFQGRKVTGSEQLVEAVKETGVGAQVSLDVIHLGRRKTLQLTLEPVHKVEWKYPSEPEAIMSWRPGKVFKIGPGGEKWMEIPLNKLHDVDVDVKKFFNEVHTYEHRVEGRDCTITITGDPADEDSTIVVEADGAEHSTTVGKIDALPEKYRQLAREAVANARKSSKADVHLRSRFRLPDPPQPEMFRKYFSVPRMGMDYWSEQGGRAVERLQEQMEKLQGRMKQMEERHREMLDGLLSSRDKARPKPEESEPSASPEGQEGTI